MARKFLYVVAALVVLAIGASAVYALWGNALIRAVMVPREPFEPLKPLPADAYANATMWIARPDIVKDNPALWTPADTPAVKDMGQAAVFFIHPTSYITTFGSAHWNAALDNAEANATARRFVASQASAFNGAGAVWAPRYRQANYGAFLTQKPEADKALAAAYGDVRQAFAAFLRANPEAPLILAAHSQGSRHLLELLRNEIAGTPTADRIVAAYVVGWPVSVEADLPALGLPAATRRIASSVGKAMPNRLIRPPWSKVSSARTATPAARARARTCSAPTPLPAPSTDKPRPAPTRERSTHARKDSRPS